jgi:hypothetical protein
MMMPWWTTISMPPIMDLDHLMFTDHWEMCQGGVGGECRVVGKGQGAGTVDRVLLDCAKNCMKETRQCAGGAQIASESNNFYFKNIPCV